MFNLEIVNFQSISDLSLSLDGFTVVKGRTSSGKSAIRRAIRFLLHNEWDKSFLRNGEKECRVTLSKGDEWSITRLKGDKKNSYIVDRGGNVTEYNKIGTDVPLEFKEMGISLLECDGFDCDVIVYCQRDPLFLTAYSQVEKTHVFNQLFGTYRCELAGKLVKRDIVSNKTRLNQINQELDESRKDLGKVQEVQVLLTGMLDQFVQLGSLASLRDLGRKIEAIKGEEAFLHAIHTEAVKAEDVQDGLDLCDRYRKVDSLKKSLESDCGVLRLRKAELQISEQIYDNLDVVRRFLSVDRRLGDVGVEAERLSKVCEVTSQADSWAGQFEVVSRYGMAVRKRGLLVSTAKMVEEVSTVAKSLLLLVSYQTSRSAEAAKRGDLEVLDQSLASVKKDLPEVCPTCGQPIAHTECV